MALRTGAGTGVIVSLVVFVLTTVFLLVLTIVFYAGQTKALEEKAAAENSLAKYVSRADQSSDLFRQYEAGAAQDRKSVARYMHDRYEKLMGLAEGNPTASFEELQSRAQSFGVAENQSLLTAVRGLNGDLRNSRSENEGLNNRLNDCQGENDQLRAQMAQQREGHQQELDEVKGEIGVYRAAAEDYGRRVDELSSEMERAQGRLRDRYEARIADLENENDTLGQEMVVLRARLDEYERLVSENKLKARSPEKLVDGGVIEIGSNDQVFIDRGRDHRVVLGMTFEVYDDAGSIGLSDPRTGELPRGKASLEVIKVGDATSTCKITRSVSGRPVVRGDVIANAVYDPKYRFKFLVHGKFDTNGDSKSTEAEADWLRSLVIEWGGTVVTGDTLPGDLDFLVMGEVPPKPAPLPNDPTELQLQQWLRMNEAHDLYNRLFRQAREAQIPVLNANRFFILTGYTER